LREAEVYVGSEDKVNREKHTGQFILLSYRRDFYVSPKDIWPRSYSHGAGAPAANGVNVMPTFRRTDTHQDIICLLVL